MVGLPLLALPQQIALPGGIQGTFSFPSSAPYSTQGSWRIEGRGTIPAVPSSGIPFFLTWNGYALRAEGGPFIMLVQDSQDGASIQTGLNLTAGEDMVWRFQKNAATGLLSFEKWKYDGSNYQSITAAMTAPVPGLTGLVTIGDSSFNFGTVAFLRGYSTVVALNSKPPFGGAGVGNLFDFEFNGNGSDVSGHRLTMSGLRGASYTTANTYPPACIMPPQTTFRAGQPVTGLDWSNSFPLDGGSTISYVAQQISGNYTTTAASSLQWSSQTAAKPTLSGFIAGSYTIQLTVTDGSNQSTTCSTKYGAVATDANGSVIIPNPVHAKILGPIMAAQSNPWQSYVTAAKAYAANIMGRMAGTWPANPQLVDYWNAPANGTVTVTSGSPAVVGSGTTFTTTFCQGPGSPTVPKQINGQAPLLVVWYVVGGNLYPAGTTGRRMYSVLSCSDDTHMTLGGNYRTDTYVTAGSGLTYSYIDMGVTGGAGSIGGWTAGNSPGNYYDNVMAFYALWYSTGIDDYLVAARTLADMWWSYMGIDKGMQYDNNGDYILQTRSLSMLGLFLRNADNPPYDYTPGITMMINYLMGASHPTDCNVQVGPVANPVPPPPAGGTCGFDLRESGYGVRFVATDAMTNSNPAQVAADLAALSRDMNNKWTPAKTAGNFWQELISAGSSAWETGTTVGVTPGSPAVTISGGTWNSNWFYAGTPPYGQFMLSSSGTHMPVNNAPFDSQWYWLCYTNPTTAYFCNPSNGSPVNYNGSFYGTGLGWEMGYLGYGLEPWMNGMLANGFYAVSQALAASDPTNAANAALYTLNISTFMQLNGVAYPSFATWYAQEWINCTKPPGAGGSTYDKGACYTDPALNDQMGIYISSYLLNPGVSATKLLGDQVFAAMFACAPGEPYYSSGGICNGLLKGTLFTSSPWKYFGQYFGNGAGWSWPSARLGGLTPPVPRAVQVSLDFQTATQAVLTVIRPDGTTSQVTCTSSPCPVTIDARQGDHLLSIKYLDPANRVLIPPRQTIVKAR